MNTDFSQPFNPEAYAPSGKADMRFRRYVEKGMPWFYGIVFPVILGFCLYTYEKETLFRIQELNLFLPDSTFYHTLSAYPGGTLQWAACFLTQFFYYPAAGTALLIAVWVCICFVMRSAFRLSPSWSFLPAASWCSPVGRHSGDGLFHLLYQITRLFLHGLPWHIGGPVRRMDFQPYSQPEPILGLRVDDRMASRRLSFIRSIRIGRHGLHGSALLAYAGHAI